jgi:protein-disulfide isomerase/uncharacterized membrane protein
MSRRAALFALVCAVVGAGVSAAAAYTHYHLLYDPNYRSFCDVSEYVSCTQVYMSRFSMVRGVPVAIFGGIWFVVAGLLAVSALVGRDSIRESVPGYLFAMSTLALSVALYLGYASFFLLRAVCLLCLTTYAAVIGLFLVSGAASTVPIMSLPKRAARDLKVLVTSPLALVLTLVWAAGAVATIAMFPRDVTAASGALPQTSQDQRSELERFLSQAPRVPLVIPNDGAKVLIVKFNDFQCPACGQSYLAYKPILAKYEASNPGAVKVVLKDYPLNPTCNENVRQMLHPGACDAAVAVRLAAAKNKADAMEEWLYTHQQDLTPASVRQAARDVAGIAESDFESKYAATLDLVKGDIRLGKQLNITQTPTFFMNGIKIEGAWAPQFFDQAIAYELAHAK